MVQQSQRPLSRMCVAGFLRSAAVDALIWMLNRLKPWFPNYPHGWFLVVSIQKFSHGCSLYGTISATIGICILEGFGVCRRKLLTCFLIRNLLSAHKSNPRNKGNFNFFNSTYYRASSLSINIIHVVFKTTLYGTWNQVQLQLKNSSRKSTFVQLLIFQGGINFIHGTASI